MAKLLLTIGFYLYTIPFIIVYLYDPLKASLYPIIISIFPIIGYVVSRTVNSKLSPPKIRVPYSDISPRLVAYASIAIYVAMRAGDAIDIYQNLRSGEFIKVATETAALRYQEIDTSTWSDKIALTSFIGYATALGMQSKISRPQWLTLLIIILIESASLARAPTLLALTALFTERCLNNTARGVKDTILSAHIRLFSITIALFCVFFFSSYFRVAANSNAFEIVFYDKLPQYTIASHYLFSTWISDNYFPNWTSGYFTVAFLYKISSGLFNTGIPGAYDIVYTPFGYSNIYTQIRGLVTDFTILSPIIVFYSVGHMIGTISSYGMSWSYYFATRIIMYLFLYFIISPFYFAVSTGGFIYPFFAAVVIDAIYKLNHR